MKAGDKVKILTKGRGRKPHGTIIEVLENSEHYRVATKNGPEIYSKEELALVETKS